MLLFHGDQPLGHPERAPHWDRARGLSGTRLAGLPRSSRRARGHLGLGTRAMSLAAALLSMSPVCLAVSVETLGKGLQPTDNGIRVWTIAVLMPV